MKHQITMTIHKTNSANMKMLQNTESNGKSYASIMYSSSLSR